jgi:hypothetical protein
VVRGDRTLHGFALRDARSPGGHKDMSSILDSWLTIAPSYMSTNAGGGGPDCRVSANENSYTHGAKINFVDLT